jgi:hypothetical protein
MIRRSEKSTPNKTATKREKLYLFEKQILNLNFSSHQGPKRVVKFEFVVGL